MKLEDINLQTPEGRLLMAALAIITTECRTNKTPNECLVELGNLSLKINEFVCYKCGCKTGNKFQICDTCNTGFTKVEEAQDQTLRQPLVSGRSEQFCPECKSLNVELDYGLGELYCHKCEKLVGRNFH